MKYYKILKDDLKHHDMQYKEGLNTDINGFDSKPCCGGGLFFSDAKHIFEFLDYGTKIAEVEIPDGVDVIQVSTKFKAHSIILKNIRVIDLGAIKELVKQESDVHTRGGLVLEWASEHGHLEIVKYLAEQGVDIHADDNCALIWAAKCGHLEIVKYLVEQGSDVQADDNYALELASGNGHLEVVKYLVEQGADVHADNDYALELASGNGHLEIIKYLKSLS